MHVTFVGYSWNIHKIFLYSIFSEHYSVTFPDFHRELFPNILGIYHGNVQRIFHGNIFAQWVAFWNNQNWLNNELIIWSGLAM